MSCEIVVKIFSKVKINIYFFSICKSYYFPIEKKVADVFYLFPFLAFR